MILTGIEIQKQVESGRIKISPFNSDHITTNSYDLTLGTQWLRYTDEILDPRQQPQSVLAKIPEDGLLLKSGDFILCSSMEKVGGDHYVPILHAKSGTARMGLFVHVTADLIDIGSYGNLTLQLYATLPVRIYTGMKIAQVTFWQPHGKIKLYQGKYQGSEGPQPTKIYSDFLEEILKRPTFPTKA